MNLILQMFAAAWLAGNGAQAQPLTDAAIVISGFTVSADGPEKHAGVSRSTGDVRLQPTSSVFSMFGCGYFSVQPGPNPFEQNATFGWKLEITPLKVVDHVVTFRLRWVRALDTGPGMTPVSEDLELTLKPGESRPIDTVPVAPTATTTAGSPCRTKSASLKVSVEFPYMDRRLIAADVWLVERLPNGKEQSQLQSVRGIPHRAMPFYFDRVSDGTSNSDFSGRLVADIEKGGIKVDLETTRAVPDPGQAGYQAARFFRSTVRLAENETVEVALNETHSDWAPKGRVFVLRIRARQVR